MILRAGQGELLELSSGDAIARVDPGNGGRLICLEVAGTELLSSAESGRVGPAVHGVRAEVGCARFQGTFLFVEQQPNSPAH